MKRRILRSPRSRGQALVETALCTLALFIFLFGLMELGLTLYFYHSTSEIARMGTRYAIVRGSRSCVVTPSVDNCNANATAIRTYVASLGYLVITSSNVSVSWCNPPTGGTVDTTCTATNAPGNLVQVKVTYSVPLLSLIHSTPITMSSTSEMMISQ